MGDRVIKKANSKLKFLYRKGKYLTVHAKKLLVTALIQCHFDYASAYWYKALTVKTKNKLQTTQNRLIRFTLGLQSRTHIGSEHFIDLGWLPVHLRVNQIKLSHCHRILHGKAPEYLKSLFSLTSDRHSHNTRFSECSLSLPSTKSRGKTGFCYTATECWNNLDSSIKTEVDNGKFKKLVKTALLQNLVKNEKCDFIYY